MLWSAGGVAHGASCATIACLPARCAAAVAALSSAAMPAAAATIANAARVAPPWRHAAAQPPQREDGGEDRRHEMDRAHAHEALEIEECREHGEGECQPVRG
jgi:hypothetical protein